MKLAIKILTITIIYLSVCLSAYTQVNLIKDGSFEDTTVVWQNYANYQVLKNWYCTDTTGITAQNVNYWLLMSTIRVNDTNISKLPYNPFFHQYPKYGHGAINMVPYHDFIQYYNLKYMRSILKGSLHQQLIAGKQYCATIYVTQSERPDYYNTNGVGLYFDNGGIDTAYTIHHDSSGAYTYVTPQVQCGFLIDDTLNWMKIQGSFTANGTEDHITIGNFLSDSATQKQPIFGGNGSIYGQNILIDNVSLVPIDLHDWLQPTYYSALQDSVWVGLPKYDYSDGNWYTINKTYITTGPGFWLHAPLENGKQFIHEIDVCGVMKYDTTTLIQAPMAINGHHKANFNVSIYPNPSAGKFTIDCLDAMYNDVLQIEVVDVLGRVLYAQQRKANLGIVAINTQLTTGNYIVKIKNAQGTVITKKITVN